jgi:hypothetical protein
MPVVIVRPSLPSKLCSKLGDKNWTKGDAMNSEVLKGRKRYAVNSGVVTERQRHAVTQGWSMEMKGHLRIVSPNLPSTICSTLRHAGVWVPNSLYPIFPDFLKACHALLSTNLAGQTTKSRRCYKQERG